MDDTSFENIVDRFYEPLYRFAMSLARHEADASDLTQETFYVWATKGHQLRDRSKAKSWLFTTLHREFLGRRRRSGRFQHQSIDNVEHELPTVDPNMPRNLDSSMVLDLLQEVDEVYRTPLILFYLKQHSYLEIADILSVPIGTVMSRLARGKARLKALLAQADSDSSKIVKLDDALKQSKKAQNDS